MSIGQSGRIVIEIDPLVKRELHAVLARNGTTMKDWFLKSAVYCIESGGPRPEVEGTQSISNMAIKNGGQNV